ncbi:hypothetical protein ACS4Y4_30605, partial [Escherichia coli]|uniref:hypothetical protein n=1 Tax=Escherichia coli TaxID=562 RepID=UPI003F420C68
INFCFSYFVAMISSSSSTMKSEIKKFDGNTSFCVTQGQGRFQDTWIMDTGASQHMTPNKKWFTTYRPINGGILLDNNHVCKVARISTVQIKMHDGVIRTLSEVNHIPA